MYRLHHNGAGYRDSTTIHAGILSTSRGTAVLLIFPDFPRDYVTTAGFYTIIIHTYRCDLRLLPTLDSSTTNEQLSPACHRHPMLEWVCLPSSSNSWMEPRGSSSSLYVFCWKRNQVFIVNWSEQFHTRHRRNIFSFWLNSLSPFLYDSQHSPQQRSKINRHIIQLVDEGNTTTHAIQSIP